MGLKEGAVRGGVRNVSTGVSVIPDSVVDNFEAADADPVGVYGSGDDLSTYYSGDLSYFSRTTTGSLESQYSLVTSDSDDRSITSLPGDGLNRYPEKGETFSSLIEYGMEDQSIAGMIFGLESGGQGYIILQSGFDNEVQLLTWDNGRGTILDSTALTASAGQTYEFEVIWGSNDQITCNIYGFDTSSMSRGAQQASVSATDATRNGTGIGWYTGGTSSSTGSRTYDFYRVLS